MAILEYKLVSYVVEFETVDTGAAVENFYFLELGFLGEQEGEFVFSALISLIWFLAVAQDPVKKVAMTFLVAVRNASEVDPISQIVISIFNWWPLEPNSALGVYTNRVCKPA